MNFDFFNVGNRVYVRPQGSSLPAKKLADCDADVTAQMIVAAIELLRDTRDVVAQVEKEMEAASGAIH